MKNPYEVLGIQSPEQDVTQEDIKAAYRRRSADLHPDKGGTPQQFAEIHEAWKLLRDPKKRRIFDRTGDANLASTWTATIEATLAEILNRLLDAGVLPEDGLVKELHSQLAGGLENLRMELTKTQAMLARCREAAASIVYLPSDTYPNVLGDALAVRQVQLLAKIEGLKINTEATNEGIAYLSSFRDRFPKGDA